MRPTGSISVYWSPLRNLPKILVNVNPGFTILGLTPNYFLSNSKLLNCHPILVSISKLEILQSPELTFGTCFFGPKHFFHWLLIEPNEIRSIPRNFVFQSQYISVWFSLHTSLSFGQGRAAATCETASGVRLRVKATGLLEPRWELESFLHWGQPQRTMWQAASAMAMA